jgi:type I restriction enzyme, S subunit
MRDGWRETTVGELADVVMGRQLSPDKRRGVRPRPYLRAANVQGSTIVTDDLLQMDFTEEEERRYAVHAGDVLLVEGGNEKSVGAAALVAAAHAGLCIQNTLIRLRVRNGVPCLPQFLHLLMAHEFETGRMGRLATGTTIAHLGARRVPRIRVLLPPLPQQRRIVDLIGTLDDVTSAAAEQVRCLRLAHGTLREEMLAAAEESVSLDRVLERIEAGRSPDGLDRQPADGEASVLKVSAVRQGWFDRTQVKVVPDVSVFPDHAVVREGDLLITRANTRELVGLVCVVESPYPRTYLCDKTLRLVPNEAVASRGYLHEVLQSAACRRQLGDAATGTSASMKNISQSSIRSIRVPLLPAPEQTRLVEVASSLRDATVRATKLVVVLSRVRFAAVSALLAGDTTIPESYDRFLDGVA